MCLNYSGNLPSVPSLSYSRENSTTVQDGLHTGGLTGRKDNSNKVIPGMVPDRTETRPISFNPCGKVVCVYVQILHKETSLPNVWAFVSVCVDVSAPMYTDVSQLDLVLGDRALTLVIWLLFACLWLLSSLLSERCSFPLPLNFSFVLLETIPEYFFHLPFHSPSSCVFEVCLVKPPQQVHIVSKTFISWTRSLGERSRQSS